MCVVDDNVLDYIIAGKWGFPFCRYERGSSGVGPALPGLCCPSRRSTPIAVGNYFYSIIATTSSVSYLKAKLMFIIVLFIIVLTYASSMKLMIKWCAVCLQVDETLCFVMYITACMYLWLPRFTRLPSRVGIVPKPNLPNLT